MTCDWGPFRVINFQVKVVEKIKTNYFYFLLLLRKFSIVYDKIQRRFIARVIVESWQYNTERAYYVPDNKVIIETQRVLTVNS
jgi:hypothetical protein